MSSESFRAKYGPAALVAGAAQGIGAEYSRQIAAHGLDVVLLDRDEASLAKIAQEIRAKHGVDVRPCVVDLARPDLADAIAPALAGREIGLLVYNAAVGTVAPFLETRRSQIDAMVDVNCRGPLQLAYALAPAMVERKRGGVILMSSMSGNCGSAQLAVYAGTKAFNLAFGDALWFELGQHGVDVLVVQPGSTRTPGWLTSQPTEPGAEMMPAMDPADVAREALATLGVEPLLVAGEQNRQGAAAMAGLPRRQLIELMSAITVKLVRNNAS
jgi:uncharacterized protein